MTRSAYNVEGKFEEQERDVKKFWKKGRICLAVMGIENQSTEDPDYIFRDFGYNGADYRDQVRNRNDIRRERAKRAMEGKPIDDIPLPDYYPVVTVLLYFGDTPWCSSLQLKDHLKIPKGLEEYVSDYKVNLFEIAFLPDETVRKFKSDFRYVAEYFVANRKKKEGENPEYTISLDHLQHVEAFAELMNAITNSDRFTDIPKIARERGTETMYTLMFDAAEARGEARGAARGSANTAVEMIKNLMDTTKWTAKEAMDALKISADKQKEYAEKLNGGSATTPAMAEPAAQYDPAQGIP